MGDAHCPLQASAWYSSSFSSLLLFSVSIIFVSSGQMGNSRSLSLNVSQDVGTRELERLWAEYAGTSTSMPRKNAHKFLKSFAKVLPLIFVPFQGSSVGVSGLRLISASSVLLL